MTNEVEKNIDATNTNEWGEEDYNLEEEYDFEDKETEEDFDFEKFEEEYNYGDKEIEEDIDLDELDTDFNLDESIDKETEENKEEYEEDLFPELDFNKIEAANFKTKSAIGGRGKASEIRIINSKRNGKRITLKNSLIERLGNPKELEFGFLEDTLIIAKGKSKKVSDVSYNLRKQSKNTYCIYNTNLVEEITKRLKLDFSNNVTVNLEHIRYKEIEEETIVMAKA